MGGAHLTQDVKVLAGKWGEMKEEIARETIGIGLDQTTKEIQHCCLGYLFCHGLSSCWL